MRTSKLCSIAEISLGKRPVTSEAQCPPQAGHLLQILRISHSMKTRCELLIMTFLHPHVNIVLSHVAGISFSFTVLLQVKFKIALCHSALCEHREALQEVPCFSFTFVRSFILTLKSCFTRTDAAMYGLLTLYALCRWKVFLRK